jgi:hypothetical protein
VRFLRLTAACAFATALYTSTPTAAPAQMQMAAPSGNPVQVSTCNPQRGRTSPGFVPAFYPPSPYYWPDAYGYQYYQPPPITTNPTIEINYMNATNKTMKSIEFGLVARGALVAEVRDVGTFSPNVEIKHSFGLNPNVFPLRTGLPQCVALRITYADGTKWKNPQRPALRRSIYSKAHT